MKRPTRPLRVAMLTHPDVQMLDVVGPLEVFSRASRLLAGRGAKDGDAYRVEIIGIKRGLITASSGLSIRATRSLADAGPAIDTLLVAGGRGTDAHVGHPGIRRFLRRQARRVRRLGSICTGAFLLADAGLLDGRPATTHWASCEELAERFPRVRVEPDRIFVKDGAIYTSAGVTAAWTWRWRWSRRTTAATSRWPRRGRWSCTCGAPAGRRSSAPSSRCSSPSTSRCATCRRTSSSTPSATSRSTRWRAAWP